MKKISKATVLVLSLIMIGGSTRVNSYAAETTNDILPKQILDIADGSDEIYGEGVSIEHTEGGQSDARFVSGGIDHTHQYIVANALLVLGNDIGLGMFTNTDYVDTLMISADWPDRLGNETDAGTFAGHFYDPDTEKNWLGQTNPTAKTRALSYLDKAIKAYNDGMEESAAVYLGRGLHYVADINEPHHASNLTAINSNHSEFEKYVDEHRNEYKIKGNSLSNNIYESAKNRNIEFIIKEYAHKAKSLASKAQNTNTYGEVGKACVENAIINAVLYIYSFESSVL